MVIPFGLLDRTDSEQLHAPRFTLHASTKNKETPCGSLRASVPTKVGTCFGPDSSSPLICPSTIFSGRDPVL